jgi:hypothetical protein
MWQRGSWSPANWRIWPPFGGGWNEHDVKTIVAATGESVGPLWGTGLGFGAFEPVTVEITTQLHQRSCRAPDRPYIFEQGLFSPKLDAADTSWREMEKHKSRSVRTVDRLTVDRAVWKKKSRPGMVSRAASYAWEECGVIESSKRTCRNARVRPPSFCAPSTNSSIGEHFFDNWAQWCGGREFWQGANGWEFPPQSRLFQQPGAAT